MQDMRQNRLFFGKVYLKACKKFCEVEQMELKLKVSGNNNLMRVESSAEIQEIMIKENFQSEHEEIAICFKTGGTSGIVELTTEEFENIRKQVEQHLHLVKGMHKFKSTEEEIPF
jgi:hypothetical protein